ncbi:MAG TPA: hypothetical protein VN788_02230 [Verrucomicrobiae bacterium]|nr:hypothetical protein [Verrucomicrobiae bacterium]
MKALDVDELTKWCNESPSGIQLEMPHHLRYATPRPFGLKIDVPSEAARVAALVYCLLAVEEDVGYYGSLIWFTNWDTGTPEIERCGLRILEQMRSGYGVTQSIENAPGQLFRSDEIVDAHAFLTLAMLWGWDAYFTPHGTRYFAYCRQGTSLYLVTDDEKVFEKLLASLITYHPVSQLPVYLKGAQGI